MLLVALSTHSASVPPTYVLPVPLANTVLLLPLLVTRVLLGSTTMESRLAISVTLESIQRMVKIVTLVMTVSIVLLDMAFVHPAEQELLHLPINPSVLVARLESIVVLLLKSVSTVKLASSTMMLAFKVVSIALPIKGRMEQPEVLFANVMKDFPP